MQNKINSSPQFTGTRDKIGHVSGHVTSTYKVTIEGLQCCCVFIGDHLPKLSAKQIHRSSLTGTRYKKVNVQGHVTSMYKVTFEGYSAVVHQLSLRLY